MVVSDHEKGEVTRLLRGWRGGDDDAGSRLWEIVYADLKRLAGSTLAGRIGAEANATSLVHKAYLRLLGTDIDWDDRRHFFLVAARAMRFVLADEARRQLSAKRGRGAVKSLDQEPVEPEDGSLPRPEEVWSIHELLDQLTQVRPRQAQLVELRYFAGLSAEESAQVLGVTTRTVVRDWQATRNWLHRKIHHAS